MNHNPSSTARPNEGRTEAPPRESAPRSQAAPHNAPRAAAPHNTPAHAAAPHASPAEKGGDDRKRP